MGRQRDKGDDLTNVKGRDSVLPSQPSKMRGSNQGQSDFLGIDTLTSSGTGAGADAETSTGSLARRQKKDHRPSINIA